MADNIELNAGTGGATLATDDVAGVHYQVVKLAVGAADSATLVGNAAPIPVSDAGSSLTIDNAQLSVVGSGTEAAALRVTIASDSTGVISVDDNGSSLTVDGTVAATQSGAWNITNVSGTVSLPTGAATAAKQPALGTAGTASADVISVQGIASMTPIQVGDNSGSLTVDAPVGTPVFVRLSDGSSAISTLPVSLASVPSHAVTNAGTFAVQVDGSALTALQLIDDTVFTDDAAFTVGTSKVNAVGFLADETASDSVDEGDIGAARMTLDRKQHVVAAQETNEMRASGTAVTPKFVIIDAASSGDNTILAAVASKKIRVLSCFLVAAGAVNVRFESGAGGTALTGQMNLTTNSGFTLPYSPVGWFETASNTLLNLELSGAVSVDGALVYIEV